jgi:selenocysteine lyase/cysteine desulfurase
VGRETELIELSHVAMFTGFQQDLKAVCDLTHANDALVYADIAQSAGCTPIDVKAMGLDFCACSSFKLLMGDFGLGFLYAREDLLERAIRRYCFSFLLMPGIGPGNSRSMPGPVHASRAWATRRAKECVRHVLNSRNYIAPA